MQPLECRFRLGRSFGESALLLLGVFAVFAWAHEVADGSWALVAVGLAPAAIVAAAAWRWRARFRVDEGGVEFRRSPGRVSTRLEWAEIDELFLLDDTQFEVRGRGRQIRFAGPYDDLDAAREACLPRLRRIRETLQERALRDGRVTFRMPGGRWKAHLAYLAAILVLTAITWSCLATLLNRKIPGLPFVLLFFGGSWLWGLRRRASGLGTRVILHREGVVVRRLDGRDKIPWEQLDRTEWNEENGINLVIRAGRVLSLPASIANIRLLEEFLHEGRRGIESDAREESEGRTMIQSP